MKLDGGDGKRAGGSPDIPKHFPPQYNLVLGENHSWFAHGMGEPNDLTGHCWTEPTDLTGGFWTEPNDLTGHF